MKLLKGTLKVLLWILFPFAVVVVILKIAYVDVVTVAHNGMAPTILAYDSVLVWRDASIEHGDVVVCHHPGEEGRFVLGRVVGLPGMRIEFDRGALLVNGQGASRDVRGETVFTDPTRDGARRTLRWGSESLGNDHYYFFEDERRPIRARPIPELNGLYLLGDNRSYAGEDSRAFGTVLENECVGEVFMRFAPSEASVEDVPHGYGDLL